MNDLVDFLRARLDEDEQAASAASQRAWSDEYGEFRSRGGEQFAHILHHDPARVLREVEAKRLIIDWVDETYGPDYLLYAIALPYADHADYQQEWRP